MSFYDPFLFVVVFLSSLQNGLSGLFVVNERKGVDSDLETKSKTVVIGVTPKVIYVFRLS